MRRILPTLSDEPVRTEPLPSRLTDADYRRAQLRVASIHGGFVADQIAAENPPYPIKPMPRAPISNGLEYKRTRRDRGQRRHKIYSVDGYR